MWLSKLFKMGLYTDNGTYLEYTDSQEPFEKDADKRPSSQSTKEEDQGRAQSVLIDNE